MTKNENSALLNTIVYGRQKYVAVDDLIEYIKEGQPTFKDKEGILDSVLLMLADLRDTPQEKIIDPKY